MRVALLHPTYWPEVRRGSERLLHDLAVCLTRAGHEPTVITSRRGRRSVTSEDGFEVIRCARPPAALVERRHRDDHLGTVPATVRELLRGRYDVAHAFFNVHGWAALQARRRGGPPVVLSLNGIPVRQWLVARRHRLELTLAAVRGAQACSVLSQAAADGFARYLLREPEVVPGGVFCADYEVDVARAVEPTLLFAADPSDPRKRLELLLRAFARLRERTPAARLLIAGRPATGAARPRLPAGVDWVEADRTADLARAYATAWASVLPSIKEAFGLVLVESLAAGTPVVAARSGACPDVVDDERVGCLFEPDDEDDLLRALERALALGCDPASAAICRSHARRWDWSAVYPLYERLERGAL